MAESIYLASTLIMGLLIVGVVALALRARRWEHYTPQVAYGDLNAGGGRPRSAIGRVVATPSVWTATYILLAVVFLGGVIVAAGGGVSMAGPAVMGALGAVLAGYVIGGVYVALRQHGRPTAQAVGGAAVALGGLFLIGLTLQLVLVA